MDWIIENFNAIIASIISFLSGICIHWAYTKMRTKIRQQGRLNQSQIGQNNVRQIQIGNLYGHKESESGK